MPVTKKIVLINLNSENLIQETVLFLGGVRFEISTHNIGQDLNAARMLAQAFDGTVDCIALNGLQQKLITGKLNPEFVSIMKLVRKSLIYTADQITEFFVQWNLQKLTAPGNRFFEKKRVLLAGIDSPHIYARLDKVSDELLTLPNLAGVTLPLSIRSMDQARMVSKVDSLLSKYAPILKSEVAVPYKNLMLLNRLKYFKNRFDILVTQRQFLETLVDFDFMQSKTILVDSLTDPLRDKMLAAGASVIIESMPQNLVMNILAGNPLVVLTAMLDQLRILENRIDSFDEYLLQWVMENGIRPDELNQTHAEVRKSAFLIHPLHQEHLWQVPGLEIFKNQPQILKDAAELAIGQVSPRFYGTLSGVKSAATGVEASCDIYVMPATPKALKQMPEDRLYARLLKFTELARKSGAQIAGLGAYTKIVGDGGVTVANESILPVTTGNSFSSAATLWAAREVSEKLGFIGPERNGKRYLAKAMIIGATGSIGRVSAQLLSLVFNDLVLVGTQIDRLMILRDELLKQAPDLNVQITTNANTLIADCDLILTATSNTTTKVLDIMQVKPGALICDCSRPFDVTKEDAALRPDVLVIAGGEVNLPGNVRIDCEIGLPKPSVYACLAETVILSLEGRYEPFSYSKNLFMDRVKEIYSIGIRHGVTLSTIRGPFGVVSDADIAECRKLALAARKKLSRKTVGQPLSDFVRIKKPKTRKIKPVTPRKEIREQVNRYEH